METATQQQNTKKCPACAELVLADAKVCKHCGRKLVKRKLSRRQITFSAAAVALVVLCALSTFVYLRIAPGVMAKNALDDSIDCCVKSMKPGLRWDELQNLDVCTQLPDELRLREAIELALGGSTSADGVEFGDPRFKISRALSDAVRDHDIKGVRNAIADSYRRYLFRVFSARSEDGRRLRKTMWKDFGSCAFPQGDPDPILPGDLE